MEHRTATLVRALFLSAALTLSGCGGGSVTLTPPPSIVAGGDYSGTASDSVFGSGTVTGTLLENEGTLSGTLHLVLQSATFDQFVQWTINSGGSLTGTAFVGGSQGNASVAARKTAATVDIGPCTFATVGGYDNDSNVITSEYTATSGCSGETGKLVITQVCTRATTAASSAPVDRRSPLRRPTSC